MKYNFQGLSLAHLQVALRVRAWIEITISIKISDWSRVALRVRAWIEINGMNEEYKMESVALRVRAWIEIVGLLI